MKDISCTQGINHLHRLDRDHTCALSSIIDDGPLTTGDGSVAHALTSQICQDGTSVASIRHTKLLGANGDINTGEQLLHALLPTAPIEHDRKLALPGLPAHPTTGVHLEAINKHHVIVIGVCDPCRIAYVGGGRRPGVITVRCPPSVVTIDEIVGSWVAAGERSVTSTWYRCSSCSM